MLQAFAKVRSVVRMTSSSDTLRQLRQLGGQVERMRTETRTFLEGKERQLGEIQQQIQLICSGLVSASASPLGGVPPYGGTKRPLDLENRSGTAANKRTKEEAKFIGAGIMSGEAKFTISQENGGTTGQAFMVTADGFTEVYTDGACPNNGKSEAKAGVGVWWGDGHSLNYSRRVTGDKQTNNVAEIQAAIVAIRQAVKAEKKKLVIHTDSQFLINCVTKWMQGWKKKGWKTATGQAVKNQDDLMVLDSLLAANRGLEIRWSHVKGHSGNRGNDEADRLAVEGANMSSYRK